ncbi:H-2 class II histocompatibility antigen, I-E alpha chain-like isoform X2 [Denticeps clupeoides]|uniref:H-2 class II histocompatibility antigen, I-E alpha chain-like isoform X2 n=1 Tax=Denticeps clupeoides TaxID=299321 RepID=UPI0010A2F260|nr:H-2 class II histocompatibility antigen, I-E alpha chain-like isoform X2 [Denticeps clupeoides]
MKLFLITLHLTFMLCSEAQYKYEHVAMVGYSDIDDVHMDFESVNGDNAVYVDFTKKTAISTLPVFAVPMDWPTLYTFAESEIPYYKIMLEICRRAYNFPPEAEDPPQTSIYTRDDVKEGTENTLICHVTQGVRLGSLYMNEDVTFTLFSTLKFVPRQGDVYTCTVEHQALDQPSTREWDVEDNGPSVGPSVFCGVGLFLGLLGVAAGTFFLIKGNNCKNCDASGVQV